MLITTGIHEGANLGSKNALVLIGHGSQSAQGIAQFEQLVSDLSRSRTDLWISYGFIEFAQPTIDQALDTAVDHGATTVVAVPLVLTGAGHMKDDGPRALIRARKRHPMINFYYARALGIHPLILEVAEERCLKTASANDCQPDAVVLIGRGSTDPDANSDLYKISRLLADSRRLTSTYATGLAPLGAASMAGPLALVEPAFISLAPPSLLETLERLKKLGARSIIVQPYFLFTGVLVERIREQARSWAASNPSIEVHTSPELGPDDRINSVITTRYEEALRQEITPNCDLCIHRYPLPGYEHKLHVPIPDR
jgi:cobalt/nickel transport system ATP-binding protein